MRLLRSLCGSWGLLPASYTLQGEFTVQDFIPYARGGFSYVWPATMGDKKVAVKVIITADAKLKKVIVVVHPNPPHKAYFTSVQQLSKEAILWKHFKHRNILPLLGVSIKISGNKARNPCLVSPWMKNGSIFLFAKRYPSFNRFNLASTPRFLCDGVLTSYS